ncbi:MAG TPA: DNA-processing protein DprA, partial [Clostridia bacterium]|nr:DNA-processing protein DprA [Clostridia bacterium]
MTYLHHPREWLWMQQTFGIGTTRAHEVLMRYGSATELLSLSKSRIASDAFFTDIEKSALITPSFAEAERILSATEVFGAAVLTPDSPEYPEGLRNIHSMPLVLYALGDMSLLHDHYLISMVGTRTPDEYGIAAAKKLSGEIASLGGVVVSGMAHGIDAVCHRSALEAGGKTVAFIAAGLDIDYPKRNRALRNLVERPQNGLVLTEYSLGTQPFAAHFPLRNRLISGSSVATIIVQSKRRSGTMHTAGHALVQNRDLFAVPGSIFSSISEGCNYLLSQGAEPALSGADILLRYVGIYNYDLIPPPARQISLFSDNMPKPQPQRAKCGEKKEEIKLPDYLTAQQIAVID